MSKEIRVNLGQSEFQDTFFVVSPELTPYRQLRKIELQIRELKDSLKKADFEKRKTIVKMSRLDPEDPLEAIEIEEYEYALESQKSLVEDAESRLMNFELIKAQLIEGTPEDYWDQGYEASEGEYWVNYYSRRMALEKMAHGRVLPDTMEKIMTLPNELVKQAFIISDQNEQEIMKLEVKA
jgi:hypothetical protein